MEDARLSPPEIYAKIAELVRFLAPGGAGNVELSWDVENAPRTTIGIPMPKTVQPKPLARVQLKILAVLGKSPVPLTRKQLAPLTGSPIIEGRWGRMVKDLLTRGMIFEQNGRLTDSENKFENA